ncbi:hypothetical protein QC764_119860 [Podospora pseudoanserina]|uniref:Uncharacterized protein n=1 Tax=Podospora pseudoanserina TaxID=2609844 RepID=A0ABR0IRT1_9PEZI|nr:hypothetical protein QC764_119860 [Podospora pseudoanserina]
MRTTVATLLTLAAHVAAHGDEYHDEAPSFSLGGPVDNPFVGKWTTSTVWATTTRTITSCPPVNPDCPAHSTVLTTVTIPVSTTICPVTETEAPPPPPPPTTVLLPSSSSPVTTPAPPPPTTIGTIIPPPITTTTGRPVTAGAATMQKAGGALAVIAVAAALL